MQIEIQEIVSIAKEAGKKVMEIYSQDFSVETKGDNSPLTQADKAANEIIISSLEKLFPGIPRISEETKLTSFAERKNWNEYWLIDPLDGTKEFIKKNGEFTVNIALMKSGQPVLGVVFLPAKNICYFGDANGSFREDEDGNISSLKKSSHYSALQKINVVASRSHMSEETVAFVDELKKQGKEIDFVSSGSSIKFCLVADGTADVYPRFGPTMEWDTAAGQAVVEFAGGKVTNVETGNQLLYNKENLLNPFFIVE